MMQIKLILQVFAIVEEKLDPGFRVFLFVDVRKIKLVVD